MVLVVVALAAAACSSDDDDGPGSIDDASGTVDAESYLAEVRRIEAGREEATDAFNDALNQAYQTRQRAFEAFSAVPAGLAATAVEQAQALEPPSELEAAHERWIDSLEVSVAFEESAAEAIDDDDLAALWLGIADVTTDFLSFATSVPPEMCEATVSPNASPFVSALCDPADDLPGGQYGTQLRDAAKVMAVQISPRVSGIQPSFTDEETVAYLEAIQPDVERLFAEVISDIERLEPPEELRADHEAVLAFFGDLLVAAEEITAATAAGDLDRLEGLFVESGRPFDDLESALSDEGRLIVGDLLP